MSRFCLLFLSALSVLCAFRVMNINLYSPGKKVNDAIRKAAHEIKNNNPDIVAVQELNKNLPELLKFLGKEWSGIEHCAPDGFTGIVTKHKISGSYEHFSHGFNVRIKLLPEGREISVWSLYLLDLPYGPYEAQKGENTNTEKILSNERYRIESIVELIKHPEFVQQIKNTHKVPVIVAGGFNTPSHRDWTKATKDMHYGHVIDWPVTKLLESAAGMTDSFREAKPDPKAIPGFTWTTFETTDSGHVAPKDRIDFIFYRGSLRTAASFTYPSPNSKKIIPFEGWRNSEWPSDHFAVVTDFQVTPYKKENEPSFFVGAEYPSGPFPLIDKCPMKILY